MTLNLRIFASTMALSMAISASAQWTLQEMHPAPAAMESYIKSVFSSNQGGEAVVNGDYVAGFWTGTANSFVNFNPAGASGSAILGMGNGQQGGVATFSGSDRAYLWTGTPGSGVNLNPTGASASSIVGVGGGQQAGHATFAGVRRAGIWNGSAASWVNLHPPGVDHSYAAATDGTQQGGWTTTSSVNHAAVWSGLSSSWVDMHPNGATFSQVFAVDNNQQVGRAGVSGTGHAGYWIGSAESWVDIHPVGASESRANGVAFSTIAGTAVFGISERAGVWEGAIKTPSSWRELPMPPGFTGASATSVWQDENITRICGHGYNSLTGRYEALMWERDITTAWEFTLSKSSVAGQNSVLGTITLPATSAVNRVFVTSDNSSLVQTPPSVTVLAGQLTRNFQITTTAITSTVMTTITARFGTFTRSLPLRLLPLIPTAMVFTPTQVTGGNATSCRVVINGVAGPGGRNISTFDNSPHATTPSTVTVPAGGTQVIFPITTTVVTSAKTVTVTAAVSAGTKTGTFRINP